eukprot:COSAG02_NODE_8_length_60691_cov_104.994752_13_plen_59_part_00
MDLVSWHNILCSTSTGKMVTEEGCFCAHLFTEVVPPRASATPIDLRDDHAVSSNVPGT